MMILAIFLYISYVYNEIFTRLNVIFTRVGHMDIDIFLPLDSWKQNVEFFLMLAATISLFCCCC